MGRQVLAVIPRPSSSVVRDGGRMRCGCRRPRSSARVGACWPSRMDGAASPRRPTAECVRVICASSVDPSQPLIPEPEAVVVAMPVVLEVDRHPTEAVAAALGVVHPDVSFPLPRSCLVDTSTQIEDRSRAEGDCIRNPVTRPQGCWESVDVETAVATANTSTGSTAGRLRGEDRARPRDVLHVGRLGGVRRAPTLVAPTAFGPLD